MVYNEKTGKGFATRHALVKDYSQKDTVYLHADTMRVETFNINTDSVYRKVHCYRKVRMYRVDLQAVCDSLVGNSRDSSMTMYTDPIAWSGPRQTRQVKSSRCSPMTAPSVRRACWDRHCLSS